MLLLFTCYFTVYKSVIFQKHGCFNAVYMEGDSIIVGSCVVMLRLLFVSVSLYDNADLKILELTHNQIHTLPDDIGDLRRLECLYMRHNKITNLPSLDNCMSLKVSVLFILHVACHVKCLLSNTESINIQRCVGNIYTLCQK